MFVFFFFKLFSIFQLLLVAWKYTAGFGTLWPYDLQQCRWFLSLLMFFYSTSSRRILQLLLELQSSFQDEISSFSLLFQDSIYFWCYIIRPSGGWKLSPKLISCFDSETWIKVMTSYTPLTSQTDSNGSWTKFWSW